MNFSTEDVKRYFEHRLGHSQRFNGHAETKVRCVFHHDRNPSLSLNFEKGLWNCHAGCGGGGILDFEQKFSQCDRDAARANVTELLGKKVFPFTKPEATYEYHDARGRLLFRKLRFPNGQKFVLQRPVGKGWVNNLEGIQKKPIYKLPEVITANAVIIAEGEKDVDRICSLNLSELHPGTRVAATTNFHGAGPGKWHDYYSLYLAGKDVVILPDNDEVGRAHAEEIARSAAKYANGVKVVHLPGLDEHGDVSDYLDSHSREELIAYIANTPAWTSTTAPTSDGLICLANVEPRAVHWLWEGRIPMGTVTVNDGDPGLGKSTLALDIAARVTTCTSMPDGTPVGATGGVIFLSSEDALADTIRPRLDVANADVSKVFAFDPNTEVAPLTFPEDIARLEAMILARGVKLVIVDPLVAYLGEDINSHRDQDVRRAMAPLQRMAERTGVAIIGIRHLNKTQGGSAIYRGGGSIAIIGAARAGFLVAPDPDDPETRVFAATKSNLGRLPTSLQFRVIEVMKEAANGEKFAVSKIAWRGISERSASELLAQPASEDDRSAVDDAVEFLHEALAEGPTPTKKVQAEAKARGLSWRTVRRAKAKAGVKSQKSSYRGDWMLELPRGPNDVQDVQPKNMATFERNGHLGTEETEEEPEWWPS